MATNTATHASENGPSDPHVQSSKKRWVPLENNPAVMTPLAHHLGLSHTLSFVDVLSMTDPDLLSLVPRPIHALLWLFPITEIGEETYRDEQASTRAFTQPSGAEATLWIPQTIGNACGLMGMLYCVLNGAPADSIAPNSLLGAFARDLPPLSADDRAAYLYESAGLEEAYGQAALRGDSKAPDAYDKVGLGFTAFVRGKDGHLWELEGRRKGPVDRGVMDDDEDLLSERVLGLSVYPYINREKLTESRFSCTALVSSSEE